MALNNCCGLRIRPVEEQLKQWGIGERYCISRKKEAVQKKYTPFSACSPSVKCHVRNEKSSSFISCKNAGRHKALSFVGKGKGAVLQ